MSTIAGCPAAVALVNRGVRVLLGRHADQGGEVSRRHAGRVSHVAFDFTFVIDKSEPELAGRWPKGSTGLAWRNLSLLLARPPSVAGEPLADLFTQQVNRASLNGTLYGLSRRVAKPDAAMQDSRTATFATLLCEHLTRAGSCQ